MFTTNTRLRAIVAVAVVIIVALAGVFFSPAPASAGHDVETWAFCGVHPDAPYAAEAVRSLAVVAGVDATFGPCLPPDWASYTPANPGHRYADPATYRRLVELNATFGMRTVVYDARIWSDNPGVRQNALVFWKDHLDWIAAWDMGDEFDPRYSDWRIMIERTHFVVERNTSWTGVVPFTNHLGDHDVLDQALADLGSQSLSFDSYDVATAEWLTRHFDPQVTTLTVAVNALDHAVFTPTPETIRETMRLLVNEGADRVLIFGGCYPYNADLTPDAYFGGASLVDPDGHATSWAQAVAEGAHA